jgi:hypothetical protein
VRIIYLYVHIYTKIICKFVRTNRIYNIHTLVCFYTHLFIHISHPPNVYRWLFLSVLYHRWSLNKIMSVQCAYVRIWSRGSFPLITTYTISYTIEPYWILLFPSTFMLYHRSSLNKILSDVLNWLNPVTMSYTIIPYCTLLYSIYFYTPSCTYAVLAGSILVWR